MGDYAPRALKERQFAPASLGGRTWAAPQLHRQATGLDSCVGLERLMICDWSNKDRRELSVLEPSWAQIETAVRALNNHNLNDIYLTPLQSDPGTFLAIGGGDGRYLVTGAIGGKSFPTFVTRPSLDYSMVPLVVGGQLGEYPARWVVTLDRALSVARSFFDAGGFDCGVSWEYTDG